MRATARLSVAVGAAALVVPVVLPAAAQDEAVPGEARATAVGIAHRTSQPGATLLGDTIAEGQAPLASVRVQAVGSSALASLAYPGALVGNVDTLAEGAPPYPAQAKAVYPPSGAVTSDANQQVSSEPGLEVGNMTAQARQRSAAAHATGVDAAAGDTLRSQSLTTDSAAFVDGETLVARAVSSARGIELGGGALRIAALTSTVEARSDGQRGTGVARTAVQGAMVGDIGVVIDETGAHVAGAPAAPITALVLQAAVQGVLGGAGLDVRAAPASGGPEAGAPAFGVAETGGLAVTAFLPNGVVERFTVGAAAARSALSGTGIGGGADVSLGGPVDVPAAGATAADRAPDVGAVAGPNLGPSLSAAPDPGPTVSFGVDPSPIAERRGVGDRVLLALVAVVAGAGLLLAYARWQLLDWLGG